MRAKFFRVFFIFIIVVLGGFCFGQFRPTMPPRPPLPAPMRPPVVVGGFSGQLGMSGGMNGLGGGMGGQLGMGGGMNGLGGGMGGQLGMSGMGMNGMGGQLGMGGGMNGIGGGMGGMMGMSGMGMNGMGGGVSGNNNPYGAYTPGMIVRPIGQGGPYSVIPINPGYMIGQQGMGGGMGGMMGMAGMGGGFNGQFGMGGMMGMSGGQLGFGGGFGGGQFGMMGFGGGQFGMGGFGGGMRGGFSGF